MKQLLLGKQSSLAVATLLGKVRGSAVLETVFTTMTAGKVHRPSVTRH